VKSPDAFRTISEAADALDLPQHVLRFWETRFSQIKPMKRSGGRRYYRPSDIALLQGIRHLLYDEGYTIKGVQRILREQGIAHVAGLEAGKATPPSTSSQSTPQVELDPPRQQEPHAPKPVSQTPQLPQIAAPAQAVPDPEQAAPVQPQQTSPAPTAQPMPQPQDGAQLSATFVQPVAVPAPTQPVQAPSVEPVAHPAPEAAQPTPKSSVPSPGGSAASSLRFIPETETVHEPTTVPGATVPAPSQPMTAAPAPVIPRAQAPIQQPVFDSQPRLNAQDTETLVQALRTLLDCKAILDGARQPDSNPTSVTS
jgi:DNA-binding transcriptional MerR regulator